MSNTADTIGPWPALELGGLATLACLIEASAPKPGNVHRGADFEDLTFYDFAASAAAIGPVFARAAAAPVGRLVYDAVAATRRVVATNTNLGTVLLLAPLAKAAAQGATNLPLSERVAGVLRGLAADDARLVYEAIRLARPGGLGRAAAHDVAGPPPADLLEAMRAAAGRDRVARQYAAGFVDLLATVVPWLAESLGLGLALPAAVVHLHVRLLAAEPDSLIARKCGPEIAAEATARAGRVLAAGPPRSDDYHAALADLDFWLRADGHRRNPGTTADLIAAGLFAALVEGIIERPLRTSG